MQMTLTIKCLVMMFCSLALQAGAQEIEGLHFERYGVQRSRSKFKHKVELRGNPFAWEFRTRITEGYHEGKIDFAGYYITVIWGCGSGCIMGAMVDTRDGKVYDLPLGEECAYTFCFNDPETYGFEDGRVMYRPDSRLFVTSHCTEAKIVESDRYREEHTLFIHVWNEGKKEFELLKKVEKIREFDVEE